MFETNRFSAKTYIVTETIKIRNDGKTFIKSGKDWISDDGTFIQHTNTGLLNVRTGVNSTFGDPFGDDDDNI